MKQKMNENEQDILDLSMKKFNKPEYDLAIFYDKVLVGEFQKEAELLQFSFKSGMYGFEKY